MQSRREIFFRISESQLNLYFHVVLLCTFSLCNNFFFEKRKNLKMVLEKEDVNLYRSRSLRKARSCPIDLPFQRLKRFMYLRFMNIDDISLEKWYKLSVNLYIIVIKKSIRLYQSIATRKLHLTYIFMLLYFLCVITSFSYYFFEKRRRIWNWKWASR